MLHVPIRLPACLLVIALVFNGAHTAARVSSAAVAAPTASASAVLATPSPLWGDLEAGPHAVGYRTLFFYDLSRPPVVNQDDHATDASRARGRQMQINVWYPALARRGARSMRFAEYVRLLFQETDFGARPAPGRLAERFMENPVELGGEAAKIAPRIQSILDAETAAFADAPPAAGKFPLVVFPSYRSPATQSVMCEYLASHGFVVASVGMKGTHEAEPEINVAGMETQAADLQYVIGALQNFAPFDGERVALMGLGFSATSCFALQTRNTKIDALVSLDGGILTGFEDRMFRRTPYYDVAAVRVPLLFIHAPHQSIEPSFIEQYKYADRTIAHFPRMSEHYFLNYGQFERLVPGIIGNQPPGDTKTGHEWASRYVLNFLKAHLKGDPDARAFLRNSPEANGAPAGLVAASRKDALTPPPTLAELKATYRREGVAGVAAVFRRLRERDPQPLGAEKLVDFFNWVSYGRDPDWKARREIALMRVESFPDSARAHLTLANVAVQLKDRELARKHFNEALRLVETDPDPLLDYATRRRIEQTARQNLKNLDG